MALAIPPPPPALALPPPPPALALPMSIEGERSTSGFNKMNALLPAPGMLALPAPSDAQDW
eukprot:8123217-Karenia_brevis.AAC.1